MPGPQGTLPDSGRPRLPHVLPLLEQASDQQGYEANVTSLAKTEPKSGRIRARSTHQGHRTPRRVQAWVALMDFLYYKEGPLMI